jgi:hypothetical protein
VQRVPIFSLFSVHVYQADKASGNVLAFPAEQADGNDTGVTSGIQGNVSNCKGKVAEKSCLAGGDRLG